MAKKKKSKIDKLSPKNKEFLLNYILLGRNATKAYKKTFPKSNYDTCRTNGSKLLAKTNISEALEEYLEKIFLDKDKQIRNIFDKLVATAGADISDFIDEKGQIKIEDFDNLNTYFVAQYDKTVSDTQAGRNVKQSIKMMDKLKAISELVKILGMITEKTEHSGTIEFIPGIRPKDIKDSKEKKVKKVKKNNIIEPAVRPTE